MTPKAAQSPPEPWPVAITVRRAERILEVSFDDGARYRLPAELLRVESPSAEVQGHGAGQKLIPAGKSRVGLVGAEPVGNYALRLHFDDGHDSGIYTWRYLRALGERQDELWQAYLRALAERGLER